MSESSNSHGVTIVPVGGLGNQLFIYGAGRALSEKLACPLFIDGKSFQAHGDRSFELDTFVHKGVVLERDPSKAFLIHLRSKVREASRRVLPRNFSTNILRIYSEESFAYDQNLLNLNCNIQISGYFQSWKYFDAIASDLRNEITTIINPSDWYTSTLHTLNNLTPWIAVHVRRGDYTNPQTLAFHGLCSAKYYEESINLMEKLVDTDQIVVFSDDIESARQLLHGVGLSKTFINAPPSSRPLESLLLMSRASGFIMANSSYSWWAGWLGSHVTKPVIAPRPWFRNSKVPTQDLLLPNWISLGV